MEFDIDTLDQFDKKFDTYSAVPFFSIVTGAVRHLYGQVEAIVGLAQVIFSFFEKDAARAAKQKGEGMLHFGMGIANQVRGMIEAIPFVNLLAFAYSNAGSGSLLRRQFTPIATA